MKNIETFSSDRNQESKTGNLNSNDLTNKLNIFIEK